MKKQMHRFISIMVFLAMVITPVSAQPQTFTTDDQQTSQTLSTNNLLEKIDPVVLSEIQAQGSTDFFIWLAEQADVSGARQLATKLEKGEYVFETLRSFAEQSQKDLRTFLASQRADYRPYYIANTILVKSGSYDLLMDIAARPDVDMILPNLPHQLEEPIIEDADPPQILAPEPNITFIRATDVWAMGITGEGTVLAGGDTGMQWDHPAIIEHYRGWDGSTADHNYNWWDATGTYPMVPGDGHGHGTHITGTMIGDDGGNNQIGVAPGAQTIHCKLFYDWGSTTDAIIMECFEWILAPWDLSGQNPDPAMAPHAMNNSWGYTGGGYPIYEAIITNLVAAGIVIESSAGNSGPACVTLGSPADYVNVLAVGSVNHAGGVLPGTLTGFSSRGPSTLYPETFKPEVMAPGQNIRSSVPGNGYASWNGTSMSAPHVAGLVGLMWSANPALIGMVEATIELIIETAVPLTGQGGSGCGGDYVDGPNNDWGYGTIDALAAVEAAIAYGGSGMLEGTVTAAATGDPIADASIQAVGPFTRNTTTDADGEYSLILFEGTYDVTVSRFGYVGQTVTGVEIIENETVILDFELELADTYNVSGAVTDINTGWPLYARIDIAGYPDGPVWTNPETGEYSVDLVSGFEFTFTVNAWVDGYLAESRPVGPFSVNQIEDFELDVDYSTCVAPGYSPDYSFIEDFEDGYDAWTMSGLWTPQSEMDVCGSLVAPFPSPVHASYYGVPGVCNFDVGHTFGSLTLIDPVTIPVQGGNLTYWSFEETECGGNCFFDKRYTEVSIDGGSTWITIGEGEVEGVWHQRAFDLTPYAGQELLVRFRFDSIDSALNNYFGWMIDDIAIATGCEPQPGGLIVGNVFDGMTGDGLVNASVSSDLDFATITKATPLDPDVDDGFYTLFGPEGANELTANKSGYSPDSAVVIVGDGETIRQDFSLTSGFLVTDPESLEVDVLLGTSESVPLELINLGDADVAFEIVEIDGGFTPVLTSSVVNQPVPSIPAELFIGTAPEGYQPTAAVESSNPMGPWETLASAPFVSMDNVYVGYDGKGYQVGGYGTNGQVGIYDADTDSWTTGATAPSPFIEYPVDGCFGFSADGDPVAVLFNDTTSGVTTLHRYNIATNSWDTPPVPSGFPSNGLWAHDIASLWPETGENVCYISGGATTPGGGNTSALYAYYPDTNTVVNLGNFNYLAQGFAFHASWYVPWIGSQGGICVGGGVNAASVVSADTQCYDIAAGVFNAVNADLGAMPAGLWGMADGILFEDGDYQLWVAYGADSAFALWPNSAYYSQTSGEWHIGPTPPRSLYRVGGVNILSSDGYSFYVVGGSSGGFTPTSGHERNYSPDFPITDVPWLSADPSEGTVPALDSVTIDVTFDASVPEVIQPGLYHATLRIVNDTPQGPLNVPVTMNVIPSEAAGKLDGTVTSLGYCDVDPHPLTGATVLVESSLGDTWELITDADGYYQMWIDESHSPLTVTVTHDEHEGDIATDVIIVGMETTTVDFDLRWLKPCMSVDPESLEVTVEFGDSTTRWLTLINEGGGDADFQIQIKSDGSGPLFLNGYVPEPLERLAVYDPLAMTTEGLFAPRTPSSLPGILAAGDVLTQWPSGHTLNWGTGFSLDEEMVWVNDNAAGGGTGLNEEFTVDGNLTGKSFVPSFGGSWPGDIAYNLNTGMFWQVNVGGDNCIYEWDPAVPAATGNSICGAWTWTSQRGLAHNPETDTFLIGGWNDPVVYEVDTTGTTVKTCTLNLSISGLAYNWEAGLLFAMLNAPNNTIEVVDWASCSVVDSITVAGGAFPSYSGAGMGIDCDGNLWAANQVNNQVYLIDSGVPADLCPALEWLSVDPQEGTVSSDSSFDVLVIFDAGEVDEPGEYHAILKIHSNDPVYSVIDVPVTMTVLESETMGMLEGTVTSLGYCDENPAPLAGAEIFIESAEGDTWTVISNADGYYYKWLDEAGSPYSLTVTADEHEGAYADGVIIIGQETTTVDFELRWLIPCISVDPDSLDVTLEFGDSTTLMLTLINTGGGAADFQIFERDLGYSPFSSLVEGQGEWLYRSQSGVLLENNRGVQTLAYPSSYRWTSSQPSNINVLIYADDYIHFAPNTFLDQALQYLGLSYTAHYDGDFAGFMSSLTTQDWDIVLFGNDNYVPDSSIFDALNNYVNDGGKLVLNTWTVSWYLGNPLWTTLGINWVSDDFEPPSPVYWWDPTHPAFTLPRSVPEFTSLTGGIYGTYGQRVEPLSGFEAIAGYTTPGPDPNQAALVLGNNNRTVFKGFLDGQNSADLDGDGLLDGLELWINLVEGIQYGFAMEVPWLSTEPQEGTIPADGSFAVEVTFDAGEVDEPGQYFANLEVRSDDPVNSVIDVPVSMTVLESDTMGMLEGTVISLGYCDENPAPLAGAEIFIESALGDTWTVTTDADGYYYKWLDEAGSPYALTVTHDEHEGAYADGVIIIGQETTTVDFELRWLMPCQTVDPLELWAGLYPDTTTVETLNVCNLGAGPLVWEIIETEAPLLSVTTTVSLPAGPEAAPQRAAVAEGHFQPRPESIYSVQGLAGTLSGPDVLLVNADDDNDFGSDIQALLEAYGTLGSVDLFDARYATPTLAQLQDYDVVVTWSNYVYADPIGMGNVLADYVDVGGKVVNLMFSMGNHGWHMQGRFMTEEYTAMNGTSLTFVDICLGTYDANHPIMDGVTNVCEFYRVAGTYLTAGSYEVAQWADGLLFVAAKENQTVVSINGYVGYYYMWTGQMPDVLHNAILWLYDFEPVEIPWMSQDPTSGEVLPGECQEIQVTFDATDMEPGEYFAGLRILSNDPGISQVDIPVAMTVYEKAYLQVAHLAPFAEDASVTITLNGEDALVDFNYGDSTEYIEIPAGEYEVAVIPTGAVDPAIEATIILEADTYYTAIAVGDGVNQDLDLILLVDDLTEPEAGKFHLRLGHLAPFAPGLATADIRLQDGTPVLLDVNFGDVTGFIELDAGEYDLIITTPGGDVTLIDPLPVDFAEGMIISAFATGEGVNQDLGIFALPAGLEGFFLPLYVEPELAYLQVAHLAPFAEDASVTITLNGEDALVDFNYGDSTAYIELPAGDYDVAVIPTGATEPAIEATVTLEGSTYYTVLAVGDGVNQDLELILLEDDLTEPAEGKFHLRLGHLAPFAAGPATADVRLKDGTPVLLDVDFGDVTGFIELDAGEYDLIITTPGGDVTLIDPQPVDFAEGMIISAFATGEGVNQDLGVFALPAGLEGFFLPLYVEPEPEEFFIYLPLLIKN